MQDVGVAARAAQIAFSSDAEDGERRDMLSVGAEPAAYLRCPLLPSEKPDGASRKPWIIEEQARSQLQRIEYGCLKGQFRRLIPRHPVHLGVASIVEAKWGKSIEQAIDDSQDGSLLPGGAEWSSWMRDSSARDVCLKPRADGVENPQGNVFLAERRGSAPVLLAAAV